MFSSDQLDSLYRYGLALCSNPDTAYDVMYDSLTKYLQRSPVNIDQPQAYVMRMMRNLYFDQGRKQHIRAVKNSLIKNEWQQPPTLEDMAIMADSVNKLLQHLRPTERELLYLWAVEGYTVREISELLNQPRGTLLSQLHRLKKTLQSHSESFSSEASEVNP